MTVQSPGPEDRLFSESPEELPQYRKLSVPALLACIAGALSFFSFAAPVFWSLPVITLVLGLWALRAIRQAPEIYLGRRLAYLGMGLGLLCGGSAIALDWRATALRHQFARQTADTFIQRVAAGNPERAFLLEIDPSLLKQLNLDNLVASAGEVQAEVLPTIYRPLVQLVVDANQPAKATFRYRKIEDERERHGTYYVGVVYEMLRPSRGSVQVKVEASGQLAPDEHGKPRWFVSGMAYPYFPRNPP